MVRKILIAGLVLVCASAKAQNEGGEPVFHAASTMVTVPAVVRDSSRDFVTNLTASDFVLYDNGVQQRVKFAAIDHEPVSLVVVMQTGGTASRHFSDYADLPLFLDWLIGDTKHELMLVTFDSRVEIIWHFPVRSDGVAHSLTHLHKGDGLGAMTDAVQLAVEQLQSEPGNFRRIVLLISQENDEGSTTPPEEALRMLGKGSTAVYSLTFGADRYKVVKRMWLSLKATSYSAPRGEAGLAGHVTYTIYADSVIRAAGRVDFTNPLTGWQKLEVPLPAGIKGKLIQLVLCSCSPFKIYWNQSEIEFRTLNTERSWNRYRFPPPQLN